MFSSAQTKRKKKKNIQEVTSISFSLFSFCGFKELIISRALFLSPFHFTVAHFIFTFVAFFFSDKEL